jgi:hypothetical protein
VIGAKEAGLKVNPAVANNPLIFPTQQMLDNVYLFDPKALKNAKYEEAWNNLVF